MRSKARVEFVGVHLPVGQKIAPVQREMLVDYGPEFGEDYFFEWESVGRVLTMRRRERDAQG